MLDVNYLKNLVWHVRIILQYKAVSKDDMENISRFA